MKIIKVKQCLNCPYLGKITRNPQLEVWEFPACFYNKKRPQEIPKVTIIPDWCPLED